MYRDLTGRGVDLKVRDLVGVGGILKRCLKVRHSRGWWILKGWWNNSRVYYEGIKRGLNRIL
jgi:hypothetical protein